MTAPCSSSLTPRPLWKTVTSRTVVNSRRSSAGSTLMAMADRSRAGGGPQYQKLLAPLKAGGSPSAGRQRVVLAGHQGHLLRPADGLGQVVVDLLERDRGQRAGGQHR